MYMTQNLRAAVCAYEICKNAYGSRSVARRRCVALLGFFKFNPVSKWLLGYSMDRLIVVLCLCLYVVYTN